MKTPSSDHLNIRRFDCGALKSGATDSSLLLQDILAEDNYKDKSQGQKSTNKLERVYLESLQANGVLVDLALALEDKWRTAECQLQNYKENRAKVDDEHFQFELLLRRTIADLQNKVEKLESRLQNQNDNKKSQKESQVPKSVSSSRETTATGSVSLESKTNQSGRQTKFSQVDNPMTVFQDEKRDRVSGQDFRNYDCDKIIFDKDQWDKICRHVTDAFQLLKRKS